MIELLRSTNNTVQPNHNGIQETGASLIPKKVEELCDVGYVPTNTVLSRRVSVVYFRRQRSSKMIIKGRSLKKRHVSRTHRVAFDWLFDRVNLAELAVLLRNWFRKNFTRLRQTWRPNTWKRKFGVWLYEVNQEFESQRKTATTD